MQWRMSNSKVPPTSLRGASNWGVAPIGTHHHCASDDCTATRASPRKLKRTFAKAVRNSLRAITGSCSDLANTTRSSAQAGTFPSQACRPNFCGPSHPGRPRRQGDGCHAPPPPLPPRPPSSNKFHNTRLRGAQCVHPLRIGTRVPGMAVLSGVRCHGPPSPSHMPLADDDTILLRQTVLIGKPAFKIQTAGGGQIVAPLPTHPSPPAQAHKRTRGCMRRSRNLGGNRIEVPTTSDLRRAGGASTGGGGCCNTGRDCRRPTLGWCQVTGKLLNLAVQMQARSIICAWRRRLTQ